MEDEKSISNIAAQNDIRDRMFAAIDGPWTILWEAWRSRSASGGRYCALVQPARRDRILKNSSWDFHYGDGAPGFSQSYKNGEPKTEYFRRSDADVEPIIIFQDMHGLAPDRILVSEEFQLLMRLAEDRANGNYYTYGDDGSKELAIEIEPSRIRVRTPIIRRYQAARQLDLLLFVDSRRFFSESEAKVLLEKLPVHSDKTEGNSVSLFNVGTDSRPYLSVLMAKYVFPPPPIEECGIWPWEAPEEYPDFIIGETDTGQPIRYSCDPEGTANYFGKNPEAPNYLTPVFFRKDVLQRYYDDPRFTVTASRLSLGSMWGVQIDNHSTDFVMVFLGDIGRDIPETHRGHWRAHNVAPTQGMSETSFRQSFLAQFAETPNPQEIFKRAYEALNKTWSQDYGWPMFRQPYGSDADALRRVRIPLNDSDAEFETQLLLLCKLLVDLLNEKEFTKDLPKVENEKGIGKLERYLQAAGYQYVERDISFLRRLQELRSKTSAHAKGSGYETYMRAQLAGNSKAELITELMKDATLMADGMIELSASLSA